MTERRCKNCRHFVLWPETPSRVYYESEPEGVCAAPRPLIGSQPQREVQKSHGINCPVWEITHD